MILSRKTYKVPPSQAIICSFKEEALGAGCHDDHRIIYKYYATIGIFILDHACFCVKMVMNATEAIDQGTNCRGKPWLPGILLQTGVFPDFNVCTPGCLGIDYS